MGQYISGLTSGLDWQSMVSQLLELERKPIDRMEADKKDLSDRKDAWNEVNSKLLSFKSAAEALDAVDDFDLFSHSTSITGADVELGDLVNIAVGSNASQGAYTIKVDNLAQAQKLGSRSYDSLDEALGLSGDLLVNGRALNIATDDTLVNIRDKINALNSGDNPAGVTASLFTPAEGEYRLTLTSQNTGTEGIDLANASSGDLLNSLGFTDNGLSLGTAIANGALSSVMDNSTEAVGSLLGLSAAPAGTVTVDGNSVAIDLSTDSLQDVRDKLAAAGVDASIVSDTEDDETTYRLQVNGLDNGVADLTDDGNVLQTLGLVRQGTSAVQGLVGGTAATTGGQAISGDTLITDIDGFGSWGDQAAITVSGTDHDGGAVSGSFTIDASSTVGDLLSYVENDVYGGNVSAYVDSEGRIVVEDKQAGASSLTLGLDAGGTDPFGADGTGAAAEVRSRQLVAGEDAQITVDGMTISRSTNQITDVIAGVTLDLKGQDEDATINLNIERDIAGLKGKVSSFVDSYNEVISYIDSQFTFTPDEDGEGGEDTPTLFGDSSLSSVKSSLRSVVLSGVNGLDSELTHLSFAGISIDKEGQLNIDDDKLDEALRTDFNDVVSLFSARGSSTTSSLSYVSSSRDSAAGSYEVDVQQLATRGSTTGSGFSGTLSEDTVLTISGENDSVAQVSLSAGWNISAIVNAVNSELGDDVHEVHVGANSLYADAGQVSAITESTALSSLYDGAGIGAGLADGDNITFSGTLRNGDAVTENSFAVTDPATQTVGDFLTAVEDAYGSGYDAYIDGQGRIAIKDTQTGSSDLSLSVDTVKQLDFGAIDVAADGADGSSEGRYSIGVVASSEGGELNLAYGSYGSYSFDLAVSGGNLGLVDGTYTGTDIEGRIRTEGSSEWMTMTGKGQTLTGDDDQDVEDLVVKYTGADLGTFDFGFTVGVGEQLDRTLFHMTDSLDGYVAGKKDTLTSQMQRIDDRIDNQQRRVERKQEMLMNQFVNMETMINSLQAQMQWLNSQIAGLG